MANPHIAPHPATQIAKGKPLCPIEQRLSPIAQVKRMQRTLYHATQREGVDLRELAALACAWERLEERKRVMLGKPAPRPVDVTRKERAPKKPGNVSALPQIPAFRAAGV